MGWLLSLYIATTIFGIGVTIVDMVGALGSQSDEGDEGGTDTGSQDSSTTEADGAESSSEAGESVGHGEQTSVVAHDRPRNRSLPLRLLSSARAAVYFSLGFGPVGWFALARGEGTGSSLAWSIPVGLFVMVGARLLRYRG